MRARPKRRFCSEQALKSLVGVLDEGECEGTNESVVDERIHENL